MRQGTNPRRVRSRNNGKRHPSGKNQSFESNGPEIKVRGTAQQVLEKYLALARDATSTGDRIAAENFFQHAEHYYRVIHAEQANAQPFGQNRGPRIPRPDGSEEPDEVAAEAETEAEGTEQPALAEPEPIPA